MTQRARAQFSKSSLSSFFTIARFGPDTLLIFGLLGAATVSLMEYELDYIACMTAATLIIVFIVESAETIHLSRPQNREIVGAKCLVVKSASVGERGIVKLFTGEGRLDPELWSAETTSFAEKGKIASVVGIRSIILQIEA